jgi:hypothetical protein
MILAGTIMNARGAEVCVKNGLLGVMLQHTIFIFFFFKTILRDQF